MFSSALILSSYSRLSWTYVPCKHGFAGNMEEINLKHKMQHAHLIQFVTELERSLAAYTHHIYTHTCTCSHYDCILSVTATPIGRIFLECCTTELPKIVLVFATLTPISPTGHDSVVVYHGNIQLIRLENVSSYLPPLRAPFLGTVKTNNILV